MATNPNDPSSARGSAAAGNEFGYSFPLNEQTKLYTLVNFYEYKREVGQSDPERSRTGGLQLPIPRTVSDTTSIKISETDMGLAAILADMAVRGGSLTQEMWDQGSFAPLTDAVKGTLKSARNFAQGGNAARNLAQISAMLTGTTDGYASAIGGVIRNPHTTATFNGVQLKTHNFEWVLSPRSQQEADAIVNITKSFKERALPEISERGYALNYPDLVTVKFEGTKNLPRVDFAFIENVTVANNPEGPGFFKDGMPVSVNIQITLKEIDIRTRERESEGEDNGGTSL